MCLRFPGHVDSHVGTYDTPIFRQAGDTFGRSAAENRQAKIYFTVGRAANRPLERNAVVIQDHNDILIYQRELSLDLKTK